MKILLQIGVVLLICLMSEAASLLLPFPFPGSVLAMIVLFILLGMAVSAAQSKRKKVG